MSRKLSTMRVADTCHTSTGVLILRNVGSSSWAIVGMGDDGVPRQIQTSPYRSSHPYGSR